MNKPLVKTHIGEQHMCLMWGGLGKARDVLIIRSILQGNWYYDQE
jgi:hypothetical protein